MGIEFVKMEAAGNDYVYLDGFRTPLSGVDLPSLTRRMSRPHTGIGADGVILLTPSDRADFRMRIFNADGSEAEMCGNGIRCAASYARTAGIASASGIRVETGGGIRQVWIAGDGTVTVSMGRVRPYPVSGMTGEAWCRLPLGGEEREVCSLTVGNPHAVLFVPDPAAACRRWGNALSVHPRFPDGVNAEFVAAASPACLTVSVWERGSGETLACGSGACAAVWAAVLRGDVPRRGSVTVRMPGGELTVTVREDGTLFLSGKVRRVYRGVWEDAGC